MKKVIVLVLLTIGSCVWLGLQGRELIRLASSRSEMPDDASILAGKDPQKLLGLMESIYFPTDITARQRCKNILQLVPDHPAIRASYIIKLQGEYGRNKKDQKFREFFETELKAARSADPKNALYDFLLAAPILEESTIEKPSHDGATYEIKDLRKAEEGLAIILEGSAKLYCNSFSTERLDGRLALYPSLGVMDKLGIGMATMTPEIMVVLDSAKRVAALGEEYEKRKEDGKAIGCYQAMVRMGNLYRKHSRFLIQALISRFVLQIGNEKIEQYHLKRDHAQEAKAARAVVDKLKDMEVDAQRFSRPAGESLGIMDSLMVPSSYEGPFVSRDMEYAWLEAIQLPVIHSLYVTLLLLLLGLMWGLSRALRKQPLMEGMAPITVSWSVRKSLVVIVVAIMIPLLFWTLYGRYHPSRQYGLPYVAVWILGQSLSMMLVMITLLFMLVGKKVNQALNKEAVRWGWVKRVYIGALGLLFFVSFFWVDPFHRLTMLKGTYYADMGHSAGLERFYIFTWLIEAGIMVLIGVVLAIVLKFFYRTYESRLKILLVCKSAIPLVVYSLVLMALWCQVVTLPHAKAATRLYDRLVDGFIEDEVGMTSWKALRDLKLE